MTAFNEQSVKRSASASNVRRFSWGRRKKHWKCAQKVSNWAAATALRAHDAATHIHSASEPEPPSDSLLHTLQCSLSVLRPTGLNEHAQLPAERASDHFRSECLLFDLRRNRLTEASPTIIEVTSKSSDDGLSIQVYLQRHFRSSGLFLVRWTDSGWQSEVPFGCY